MLTPLRSARAYRMPQTHEVPAQSELEETSATRSFLALASQHAGVYADPQQGVVTMCNPDTEVSVLWLPDDQADSETGYFRLYWVPRSYINA